MKIRIIFDLPIPVKELNRQVNEAIKILKDNNFIFDDSLIQNKEKTELYIEGEKSD